MTNVLRILVIIYFSIITIGANGEPIDTISISAKSFRNKKLRQGLTSYVVFNKKDKVSPANGIYISNIKVEKLIYHNRASYGITQQWVRSDSIFHSAYTVLNGSDYSTLYHETYWSRNSYSLKFDFVGKVVTFIGNIGDSLKTKVESDFNESVEHYNLNWHSDLEILSLLPFKKGRVFKINFYDPGFGKTTEVFYRVKGKAKISVYPSQTIRCWILETDIGGDGYQRFWISMHNGDIIKEEDYYIKSYRYKIKLTTVNNIF